MPVILQGHWAACNGKQRIWRGYDRRKEAVGAVQSGHLFLSLPFIAGQCKSFRSRPCCPAPESECWRWDRKTEELLPLTVPWNIRQDPTVPYRSPTKTSEHGPEICSAVPLMLSFAREKASTCCDWGGKITFAPAAEMHWGGSEWKLGKVITSYLMCLSRKLVRESAQRRGCAAAQSGDQCCCFQGLHRNGISMWTLTGVTAQTVLLLWKQVQFSWPQMFSVSVFRLFWRPFFPQTVSHSKGNLIWHKYVLLDYFSTNT